MADHDTKTIPLSRGKQAFVGLACLGFVAVSAWLLTLDADWIVQNQRFGSPLLVRGIGVLGILFFGALAIFNLRKVLDRRPGIVLNEDGLLDNSTGVSVGFVPWSEITGVDTYKTFNQRTLVVRVSDPRKYLGGGNAIIRYLRRSNLKLCGSPVTITPTALKIRYDDLMTEIQSYHRRYGRAA